MQNNKMIDKSVLEITESVLEIYWISNTNLDRIIPIKISFFLPNTFDYNENDDIRKEVFSTRRFKNLFTLRKELSITDSFLYNPINNKLILDQTNTDEYIKYKNIIQSLEYQIETYLYFKDCNKFIKSK